MKNKIGRIEYGYEIEPKGQTSPLFKQVHGAELIQIDSIVTNPPDADGAYTSRNHLTLSVFTADCIPILYFTEDSFEPIAVAHCGWRGAEKRIASKVIETLYPNTKKLHAVLGPCILKCCFEVKEDLISAFEKNGHKISSYLEKRDNRIYFDLYAYVKEILLKGVSTLHEELSRCTVCSTPTLPSYRRQKSTDPRIRSWIRKL